jgi:flagella basal body P-ring formation protein FlgA
MKTVVTCLTILLWLIPGLPGDLPAATVEEAITEHMASLYDLDLSCYEIEVLRNPFRIDTIAPSEFELQPMTRSEPLGLFSIRAAIVRKGEEVESHQVRLRISHYDDVLVVLDRVGRAEILDESAVELRRVDITELREKPLRSAEEFAGLRTKRNLRRGEVLTSGDFEPIPDVERGSEVQITFTQGRCVVTAPGEVLETGAKGDIVRVRNKASRKIITARVVDGTAVAVDP